MELTRIRPQRIRLMGEPIDLVTPPEVMTFTARKVAARQKAIIANHNTHSLYLMPREPEMRAFFSRADLIELDSIPLAYWGKLTKKPVGRGHRCTYLDWRDDFWRMAQANHWRVFYLGGVPGASEVAAERLEAKWPGVTIAVRNGYFVMAPGSAENRAVVDQINAFEPHIVFVGMGMPRQEVWIHRNYDALTQGVVFSVGGAFDYEAGYQKAAPRWLAKLGFEWAFRLGAAPRRLFARYLVEPWHLMPAALRDLSLAYGPAARRPTLPRPAGATVRKIQG